MESERNKIILLFIVALILAFLVSWQVEGQGELPSRTPTPHEPISPVEGLVNKVYLPLVEK